MTAGFPVGSARGTPIRRDRPVDHKRTENTHNLPLINRVSFFHTKGELALDSISGLVQSPIFSHLVVFFSGLAAIAFFWWRAGSIHSILEGLWHLVSGKLEVQDPTLQALFQRNRELEKFRFIYGIKADSLAQIRALADWLDKHDLDISHLQRMRRWVELASNEVVVEPPRNYFSHRCAQIVLALLLMFASSQPATSSLALLKFRDSGKWFTTDAVTVQSVVGNWSFDINQCERNQAAVTQASSLSVSETRLLCDALKEGSLKELAQKAVSWQRGMGIAGVLLSIGTALLGIMSLAAAANARELRKRLVNR